MRVYCTRCHSPAIITSRKEVSPKLAKLYCVCGDANCAHGFVVDLQFSHTLSPSAYDLPKSTREKIKKSNQTEILNLFAFSRDNSQPV